MPRKRQTAAVQRHDALQAATNERDTAQARADQAEGERDALRLRLDRLEAERDGLKGQLEALAVQRSDEAQARVKLLVGAAEVLGTVDKLDGLTDHEVRAMVVRKAFPRLTLDGKPEAHVEALYDHALQRHRADALGAARAGANVATRGGAPTTDDRDDAEDVYAHRRNAHARFMSEGGSAA